MKRKILVTFLFCAGGNLATAALSEETSPFAEQLHLVDLKISVVEEQMREKVRLYHRLEMGSDAPQFLWEDAAEKIQDKRVLARYLKVSIRESAEAIEGLKKQRLEVLQEKDWQQIALDKNPSQTDSKLSKNFQCQSFPAQAPSELRVQLSQDFGKRTDPETGLQWNSQGWWLSQVQPEVKSCAAGTVVFAGPVPGRGRVLILDHGQGVMTLYANLNEDPDLVFTKGERLKSGRRLGTVREKFYFEVRRAGVALNPRLVFSSQKLAILGL